MAMLLDEIRSPADLRGLNHAQLKELAREIRDFIVDAVSRSAGHLGSNLGVVELTLALHRVFDSPKDMILWDTGHLAYVHKILTGRKDDFATLRQADGLSGYPCRAESPHDWVENSHASTILSYAYGLAMAEEMRSGGDDTGDGSSKGPGGTERRAHSREGRRIVAVIGDGAMTGGMAYEALNNLGHSGKPAIIVLNDNGRSYAPTISRLSESLSRLRLDPRYLKQRARLEDAVRKVPMFGQHIAWGMSGATAGLREMFEPPVFFETLGVRYTGPFDGHDVEGLERALHDAAAYDGPIVVHVLTQKGRGYPPAEMDEEKNLHDIGLFDPETGAALGGGKGPNYTAAFTEALIKEGEARPELVAITAAMPGSTGLLPFAERFPDRMVDVGIAEQHAVTSAAGMAMGGLRPVVALYSTFLSRAFDQMNLDVGLHGQPVVFCLDRAGITGDDGPSHHGVLDLVLLTKVPGMTVFAPSSYQELQLMLHEALEITDGPTAIRWPKTAARVVPEHEVGHGLAARLARPGTDVALVGVGKMLGNCLDAAENLAADGISCQVWDPRVVKPLDPAMIDDLRRFPLVVTVEDGLREGGAGTAIADAVATRCQTGDGDVRSGAPVVRVLGTPVSYLAHGKADQILADLGLDASGITDEVRRLLPTVSASPPA